MKTHRFMGTAMFAVLSAGTAQAQSASQAVTGPTPAAKITDDVVADIIVTAERRSTNIQKTALSITAINGDTLKDRGIKTAYDLTSAIPGFRVAAVGVLSQFAVRGTGSFSAVTSDTSVSFNLDGISIARSLGVNGLFYDLERVEILKGPQGTLFGRNAASGAVNVVSKSPTFEFGGSVGLEVGNFNLLQTNGVINVPLSDTVAMRASFQTVRHDGYFGLGYADQDDVAGRVKLLFKPSSDLSLLLTGAIYHSGGKGLEDVPLRGPGGTFVDPSHPYAEYEGPADFNIHIPADGRQNLRNIFASGEMNYSMSFGTLTVLSGYNENRYKAVSYAGGQPQRYDQNARQYSIETRLASEPDKPLTWIVGGLYFRENMRYFQAAQLNPAFMTTTDIPNHVVDSLAGFGQLTWHATDHLRFIGGLRYTDEHKTTNGTTTNAVGPGTTVYPSLGDTRVRKVTYRGGVEFDAAPASLLYANVSTGFKGGDFNPGLAPNVYLPETLTAYSIGSKNQFFDKHLLLNAELFYWIYKGMQIPAFGFVNPIPNIGFVTYNANRAVSKGGEVQTTLLPTPRDRISLTLQYLDSKFTDFKLPATAFQAAFDYTGLDLSNAPTFSLNGSYQHTFTFSSGATLTPAADVQHESSYYITLQRIPGVLQSGYWLANARLTYQSPSKAWQLSGWVRNLADKVTLARAGLSAGLWGSPRPPRTYGLSASANF